jgi:hypothetical protein
MGIQKLVSTSHHEIRVFEIGSDDDPLTAERIEALPVIEHIPSAYEFFVEPIYYQPAYDLGFRTAMGMKNGESTEVVYLVMKAKRIDVDDYVFIRRLADAQLNYLAQMIQTGIEYQDDGGDDFGAALDLSQILFDACQNENSELVSHMLNDTRDEWEAFDQRGLTYLNDFACDGICPAIYDLNCIALEEED